MKGIKGDVAFVLSGEGARGAIQAKIIDHLVSDLRIIPKGLYGVSSGAINATGYAYLGPRRLLEIWQELNSFSKVFKLNFPGFLWKSGVCNASPIHKLLKREINPKTRPLASAKIAISDISTTNIRWVNSHYVTTESFIDFTLASISIPGVVEPWKGYADAGGRLIAPILEPILDGYKHIYVILGAPYGGTPVARDGHFLKAFKEVARFISVTLDEIMKRDINKVLYRNGVEGYEDIHLHVWQPTQYLYDPLDFKSVKKGLASQIERLDLHSIKLP